MQHYLTYKDEKSDKFWRIEVFGKSFTVTYGKTGTAGTSQTKTFESESVCLKKAKKLLDEKLVKGYIETTPDSDASVASSIPNRSEEVDYYEAWKSIVAALDIPKGLAEHFRYLVDTPGLETQMTLVLNEMMSHVKEVSCTEEKLNIKFPHFELNASAPAKHINAKSPRSYQELLKQHNTIQVSDYWYELGEHGGFDIEDG